MQEIAELKANIEKQFNEEAAERIRRYKEGFEKRIVEMSDSYNDSDVVTTIAELLEQNIVGTIKAKDRGITVETIDVVCSIEFSTKGVGRNCSLFCFEKERVEDLPSVIHATALAYTIMNKLLKLLNSRFSEKAIDSGFCLDGQIGYTQSGTVPALVIYYKAPNANYQPARQW